MIKPAGHDMNVVRNYAQPPQELVDLCLEYFSGKYSDRYAQLGRLGDYNRAADVLMRKSFSSVEAHALLFEPRLQEHYLFYERIADFLNAVYNICSREEIITFDFDTPRFSIAKYFPKIFVNKGSCYEFGEGAPGVIINEGKATGMCTHSQGIGINKGELDVHTVWHEGLLINTGRIGRLGNGAITTHPEGIVINLGTIVTRSKQAEILGVAEITEGVAMPALITGKRDRVPYVQELPADVETFARELVSCTPEELVAYGSGEQIRAKFKELSGLHD